ncbi:MAG TPA: acylphosphatase [Gammaproteobacteria bacterium]|nr:acylphosphatase [Gammaproteobacteria bacterium]
MRECRRFKVSGFVQGVFFRASTRAEAERLGITGHAENLADGCVEVLACGEAGVLDELGEWLRHGPPRARVESVEFERCEVEMPGAFTTR